MVDAFASSGAADPRGPRALAAVPQRGMSAEAIVAPYTMTAQVTGYLGQALNEATADWHREAAEEAVPTRGFDGTIQLQRRPLELTPGDRAYNAMIQQRSLGQAQNDIDRQRTDLMLKHQNDPQAFIKEYEGVVKGLATSGNRVVRGQASMYAAKTFGEAADRLKIDKYNTDQQTSLTTLRSRVTATGNDLVALARDGGTGTDAYQLAIGNMADLYTQLGVNPAYGYSKERIAEEMKRWNSLGRGMEASGGVERAWKEGGVVGGRKFIEENITNNTALSGLSDSDRAHIAQFATSKLAALQGERQIAIESLRPTVQAFQNLWDKGKPVPDELYDDAWKRANEAGADALIAQLSVGRKIEQQRVAARGVPDAAYPGAPATAGSGSLLISGASPTLSAGLTRASSGDATGAALLRQFEGFRETPYWDVNALRTGYGSDTITRADGSVVRVTQGMRVSREDAERDLARRINTEFIPRAQQTIGAEAWGRLSQNAKEAIVSVTYNYGSTPSSVAQAARSGDPAAIAQAIQGLSGHNGGVNAGRRSKEASHVLGGGQGVAGAPIPYSPEEIRKNPHLVPAWLNAAAGTAAAQVKWAEDTTSSLITAAKNDQRPSEELAAAVLQIARANPTETGLAAKIQEMTATLTGNALASEAAGMTESGGAAYMARVRKMAEGGSVYHQLIDRAGQEGYRRRVARMKSDPVNEGADRGLHPQLPPLDMNAPPARLSETIAAYGTAARDRGAALGNPMQSAFGPNEVAQVKAVASTGTPDQRLQLLSSIAAMPEAVRNATLQQIGAGGEQAVFAFAGGLAQEAPDIARSLIMGHAAMTAKEGFIPKTGANATSYRLSKDTALPVTAFPPSMRMDGSGPLAAMSQAIDARYAYLAAQAGDTTGKPNETRLRQSVNDVTGGIVWQNGAAVIAPARGMDQRTFDGVMAGLTDADLAGVTTGNGRPITADYVRSTARLHAVGAARYLVVLNRNDEAPQYAAKDGQAFVLSLKDRQPAEVYRPRDRLDPNLP